MTDLRQAAQAVLDAWDSPLWKTGTTAAKIADLRTALEQQAEPSQWRDMVVVSLVREGVNKHKARELADHFATPPQRQPLTIAEVEQILAQHDYEIHGDRARYIVRMTEEAHNIKEGS